MMINSGSEAVTWLPRASAALCPTFTCCYSATGNKQWRDPRCTLAFQNSLGSCFSQGCKHIPGWGPHPAGHRPLEPPASGPGYREAWCSDPLLASDTRGMEGKIIEGLARPRHLSQCPADRQLCPQPFQSWLGLGLQVDRREWWSCPGLWRLEQLMGSHAQGHGESEPWTGPLRNRPEGDNP